MEIEFTLNGKVTYAEIKDDTSLFDLLRAKGCYSVKCGCETENCGLCTVLVEWEVSSLLLYAGGPC